MDKQVNESSSNTRALSVQRNTTAIDNLDFRDASAMSAFEAYVKQLIATDKSPIKSLPEAYACLQLGQELGMSFLTTAAHIYSVNGRLYTDIHIIKALLLRAGVIWKCTKKYTPLYQYTDGNNIYLESNLPSWSKRCKSATDAERVTTDELLGVYPLEYYTDLKGNIYNQFEISDKCVRAINAQHAVKLSNEGKFPVIRTEAKPIDYVSEYEFTRYIKTLGGVKEMKCTSSFSLNKAIIAGLTSKDTYKHYPDIMVGHRAFVYGARDIAADTLLGMYSKDELTNLEVIDDSLVETIDDYAVEP